MSSWLKGKTKKIKGMAKSINAFIALRMSAFASELSLDFNATLTLGTITDVNAVNIVIITVRSLLAVV